MARKLFGILRLLVTKGLRAWKFRDFEQRMLKERETLEEERQTIAARREEYLREVKEWEERLDTVGQCSV